MGVAELVLVQAPVALAAGLSASLDGAGQGLDVDGIHKPVPACAKAPLIGGAQAEPSTQEGVVAQRRGGSARQKQMGTAIRPSQAVAQVLITGGVVHRRSGYSGRRSGQGQVHVLAEGVGCFLQDRGPVLSGDIEGHPSALVLLLTQVFQDGVLIVDEVRLVHAAVASFE